MPEILLFQVERWRLEMNALRMQRSATFHMFSG
jgi:hypothetical protein